MQSNLMRRTLAASHRELDQKLELLQQLGYDDRFHLEDDASINERGHYHNLDTDRWIQTEYSWALEEAAAGIPDLFDVDEDEEACPSMYDPGLFAGRQSLPATPRSRSESLSQSTRCGDEKPLPEIPPLRVHSRFRLPAVPPPSPAQKLLLSTPPPSPPASPRSFASPPSPSRVLKSSRTSSPGSSPPSMRPVGQRHATYPSISSTLSLLEERETEAEKRSAVYVADVEEPVVRGVPVGSGRGRSCSATVPRSGDHCGSLQISPRRKQRPPLPALSTSASSPQLRRLADLAGMPSPSFSVASPLLPSPMSDITVTPDREVVTPGSTLAFPPPEMEGDAEPNLASRWSLDSVASRPRITQMALDDASSLSASKPKKRDRLLSLISGRARSGSVTKLQPPPNTPRGSSDVLDIRHIDAPSPSSRPSFTMPMRQTAPSLSSNSSNASTLATPIDATHPSYFHHDCADSYTGESRMPEEEEESPVFAANPFYVPESPLLRPEEPAATPPPLPLHFVHEQNASMHEHLTLQIPDRPTSPGSPPPQPTLPLPSPSTPSPSFLVPSPRPQSFFASITGRQRRRKKKLVISGAPLELDQSRSSSSVLMNQSADDYHHRQAEQQRRVQNVVKWCESFGPIRKIETKEDGSLHVYWKDWETADMVCRIQAQVVIKDVGRVNLAWYYIS